MEHQVFGNALGSLLASYESMRALAVKAASTPAPEPIVVLEKVASIPSRVSAAKASEAADALVKRGFVASADREALIRTLCTSEPDGVCALIEKFAAMAAPLEPDFDSRLEDRGGLPTSSEQPKTATSAWLAAAR